MQANSAADEDWDLLLSFFPSDWISLARESGALKGLRQDKSAEDLLRVLLLHLGCGYSMRETVVRAREADLADLSDVALRKSKDWLQDWLYQLCCALFAERGLRSPAGDSENVATGRCDDCARTGQDRQSVAYPL